MTQPQQLAQLYFDLSNQSDLDEIAKLFTPTTTYQSASTGTYKGRDAIIAMQRKFHASFKNLHWQVDHVEEIQPGIIRFDFTFTGTKQDGSQVASTGIEDIAVADNHIQNIAIRSKD